MFRDSETGKFSFVVSKKSKTSPIERERCAEMSDMHPINWICRCDFKRNNILNMEFFIEIQNHIEKLVKCEFPWKCCETLTDLKGANERTWFEMKDSNFISSQSIFSLKALVPLENWTLKWIVHEHEVKKFNEIEIRNILIF